MNIDINTFIKNFATLFPGVKAENPWAVVKSIQSLIAQRINTLGKDYIIHGDMAIHSSAIIEEHAVIKGPAIISAHCFVAAHAYLRGGVFLDEHVVLGPGCEVKSSLIFSHSALAHFNFAGDSLIGSGVNMEAGSVIANHYNEREQKAIAVHINGKCEPTGIDKFGALIGDGCRIGANAVLSPGTLLNPNAIVKRLELIEQCK